MESVAAAHSAPGGAVAPSEVTTLIVDDQQPFLDALRQLVEAARGFTLVGEAASGEAAIEAVERLSPRLVLMDVRMPGLGGIGAARAISRLRPDVVVVLVSVHGDDELPLELLRQHAAAFVHKQDLRPRLLGELWEQHGTRV